MPMYALATIPLIRNLKDSVSDVNQVWCADNASGAEKITRLWEWWDQLNLFSPKYGYLPNHAKLGLSQRRTVSQLQQRPLLTQT